ncbi:MAG TPA: hypothetical protein VKY45_06110 [Marinilabiliaceae bacterium]|nr:hypothetical protein [Marinilabiliaceae bacterium]
MAKLKYNQLELKNGGVVCSLTGLKIETNFAEMSDCRTIVILYIPMDTLLNRW